MSKTLPSPPETASEIAMAECAKEKLRKFRESWEAAQRMAEPRGTFSALIAGYAAGKRAGEQEGDEKPKDCHGCGAPLNWVNFARQATCTYCQREYRR